MQPIRQWLAENINEDINEQQDNDDISPGLLENYEIILAEKKQWRKPFLK
jgi:hypothetical protein